MFFFTLLFFSLLFTALCMSRAENDTKNDSKLVVYLGKVKCYEMFKLVFASIDWRDESRRGFFSSSTPSSVDLNIIDNNGNCIEWISEMLSIRKHNSCFKLLCALNCRLDWKVVFYLLEHATIQSRSLNKKPEMFSQNSLNIEISSKPFRFQLLPATIKHTRASTSREKDFPFQSLTESSTKHLTL